jgi:hypothetical protein
VSDHKELRAAFVAGSQEAWSCSRGAAEQEAKRRYPAPMIIRPRVVVAAGQTQYRVVDGVVQYSHNGVYWLTSTYNHPGFIVDLLANPTETVEVDE